MTQRSKPAARLREKGSTDEERSEAAAEMARLKNSMTTPRARRRQAAQAAKALWEKMTPEERRREMKRRRRLGIRRRKMRALGLEEEA